MGNNFSSIPSLPRGNPSRAPRGHPQNLKDSIGGPFPVTSHRCHHKQKHCPPVLPGGGLPATPLLFHPHTKGSQILMDLSHKAVKRQASFCNAITFSNRPVLIYEQVRLKITKKQCCWSGALRLGFTSKDPSRIHPDSLPKYACPDLVSQSGFWAKALPEEFANEGNIIAFWVDKKGRVFYRINDSGAMLFFNGVRTADPLWALVDVYGLTRGVQLLDSELVFPDCLRPRSFTALRRPSLRREADEARLSVSLCDLNVPAPEGDEGGRPVRVAETIFVKVTRSGGARPGALSFGVTTCDPGTLRPADLPFSPEALVDRKEFWAVCRVPGPLHSGDILGLVVNADGELHLSHNGAAAGMQLCVDASQPLWMLFGLHGAVTQIRILGSTILAERGIPSLPCSPASTPTSPSALGSRLSDPLLSTCSSGPLGSSASGTAPNSPVSLPESPVTPGVGQWSDECTICYEHAVDTVIYTCGHMCLCYACGLRLKKALHACCPICRRPIKDIIKTYRSS
ncbi:PREDICTED: E3 ubiquitin-protein ligase NEURL1 [Galeopterus variegatus]|uniref:E3 ubiquitin-protein ligase NEURL1 n=1 Tax=Galeopterus variegatus TaxID=482537 RepID=A0ABM0R6W2_GALVR|nr:PREDICTED: E3 ubiquitin-protein ligase NEURL1 [Galeopterus variegatus]